MDEELTAATLRSVLIYDPTTGLFWRPYHAKKYRGRAPRRVGNTNADGYVHIRLLGRTYKAHRLVWLWLYGEHPAGEVDHKNGKRDDNRPDNLRLGTKTFNQENQRAGHRGSKTGFLGVSIHNSRYTARIQTNKVQRYLGTFDTPEEAYGAYLQAKRELHEGCTI